MVAMHCSKECYSVTFVAFIGSNNTTSLLLPTETTPRTSSRTKQDLMDGNYVTIAFIRGFYIVFVVAISNSLGFAFHAGLRSVKTFLRRTPLRRTGGSLNLMTSCDLLTTTFSMNVSQP